MELTAIMHVLSGIVALLNNRQGATNITDAADLCTNETTLATLGTDQSVRDVLNSSSALTLLNGTIVPQLCEDLGKGLGEMIPMLFLGMKMLEPFATLTGLDPLLKDVVQKLQPLKGMSPNDPTLRQKMMQPDVLTALVSIDTRGDLLMLIFTAASGLPSACASNDSSEFANDPALQRLFNGANMATFCNNTNLPELGVTVATFSEMLMSKSGGNMTELRAMLPKLKLTVQVFKLIATLPGLDPRIIAMVQALGPLEGIRDAADPRLPQMMMQLGGALMAMADPNITAAFAQIFPTIGQLLAICSGQDRTVPGTALQVRELLGTQDATAFCSDRGTIGLLRQAFVELIKQYIPESDKDAMKMIPQLLLTLNVLKPFVNLPAFDPQLRTLVLALSPLIGMSHDDPNLYLMMMHPNIQTALKSMAQPQTAAALPGIFARIGVVPTVCKHRNHTTQFLKLLNGSSITTVCSNVDVVALNQSLIALEKMEADSASNGTAWEQKLAKIPQLKVVLKILKPFQDLPGFDPAFRVILNTLAPLADLDINDSGFATMFMNATVLAAASGMENSAYVKEVFTAVGAMVEVCPHATYFTAFQQLVQGTSVDDVCGNIDDLDGWNKAFEDLAELVPTEVLTEAPDATTTKATIQKSFATPSFSGSLVVYHIVLVALVRLVV